MKVALEKIISDDTRLAADLRLSEVVEHAVRLSVNGRPRVFSVYMRANVLPTFDGNLVYGDELLEELLRFEPAALAALYAAVARHRRGVAAPLPLVLVEDEGGGRVGAPVS